MPLIHEAVGEVRKISAPTSPGVVLALSGGGAAGLAHIGVLQVLAENNIPVRAIAGTSIGAEIGAFYATGMQPQELSAVATSFDWKQVLGLFIPDLPTGGLVSGVRITEFLRHRLGHRHIEKLKIGYAAVAADLETGEQVVIDHGDLVEAVRASVSLPGLLAPHRIAGRALVDGGVLNPLPFDIARERFGGPVVAVAVHLGMRERRRETLPVPRTRQWLTRAHQLLDQPWLARAPALRAWLKAQMDNSRAKRSEKPHWTARRVFDRVFDMSLAELVRLRAQQHPPELMIEPMVDNIGTFEFYRAKEAIAAGQRAAEQRLAELRALIGATRDA